MAPQTSLSARTVSFDKLKPFLEVLSMYVAAESKPKGFEKSHTVDFAGIFCTSHIASIASRPRSVFSTLLEMPFFFCFFGMILLTRKKKRNDDCEGFKMR